ncbi:hypothetical protein ACHAXN_012643, partial [Cyclotella atomus]
DEAGSDNNSDASSTSSSRAERLRRERTQRHRQRLQRVKQFQQASGNAVQQPTSGAGPQVTSQQATSQSQNAGHVRTNSDTSSGSNNSSVASSGITAARRRLLQSSKDTPVTNKRPQQQPVTNTRQLGQQQQRQTEQPKSAQNAQNASQPQVQRRDSNTKPSINSSTSSQNSPARPSKPIPPIPPPPTPPKHPNINPTLSSSSSTSHHHYHASPQQPLKSAGPVLVSVESPLPPLVQRSLGDRSYEKRKNAALEIEQLVKSLSEANNLPMISSIISVLAKDFCTSMNANYRKGGLIGIAAAAIGLMGNTRQHLEGLLFPVLHCFDDPESRVRYYACESLYNIAKVARGSVLRYFNPIFDGLTKLFADVDVDVKNGANLLDRLIKDIVTESESFHVEHFLPLLQTYIRRTNPYIRQLLVGWITVLDSVPDISMIDYLPDFLDGLFNMLSDSNREIRQAADSALSDFLKEVRHSSVLELGPLVTILVNQCLSKDRLNRLTAITWIEELIKHPYSGGDALLPHHADVLGAILYCISDSEDQICQVAERTNADLLALVRDTKGDFRIAPLLDALTEKIMNKDDVPTKMASLRWINMLLEKRRGDMAEFVSMLLPVLLKTLSDASDAVVLLTLQVLARISLGDGGGRVGRKEPEQPGKIGEKKEEVHSGLLRGKKDEKHFKIVINAILGLFASDRMLLENRGSLVVRKFCVLLDAESVYMLMAEVLSSSCESNDSSSASKEDSGITDDVEKGPSTSDPLDKYVTVSYSVEFVSTMVQTLNLILLTASELHGLRVLLAKAFEAKDKDFEELTMTNPHDEQSATRTGVQVFVSLFRCWCHSPVATFSLCLLGRAYSVAFALVKKFSEMEVTVGFLMQIDKLVNLLESPVFLHLRLQLLDVESPYHAPLLKSCYGLLMLLPQSDAFRSLNDRLSTVCDLRDNLGIPPNMKNQAIPSSKRQTELLARFDEVMNYHRKLRSRENQQMLSGELLHDGTNRGRTTSLHSAGKSTGKGKPGANGAAASSGGGAGHIEQGDSASRGRITQEV